MLQQSILSDAFEHHVWATTQLLDACASLPDSQLSSGVPGTFGSIIDTFRHLVAADRGYLFALTGGRVELIDVDALDLAGLRGVMASHAHEWRALILSGPDPTTDVVRTRDDGSRSHAPVGIRLAQALHHGSDHRSQICTALTHLGIAPPDIDVWDYGFQDGRVYEE